MGKVRPLMTMLNERFQLFWPVENELSIDESMVPYYGRHSTKQFIRGKPIRFGYKLWCLNTRLGYLIQFDPYQGASSTYDANLGLGGSVVMDLLSEMPAGVDISVYFDNFFTTLKLLDRLTAESIRASGTIRFNRLADCGDAFPIEGVLVATYLLSVEALPHCRCGVANKNRIV